MDHSIILGNMVLSMREFQKKNNTKNQCATNVQYLYDIIRQNFKSSNVKSKAVFVFSSDIEANSMTFSGGHLVVLLEDGTVIDPSYDVFCLKDKLYFDNMKDFLDIFTNKNDLKMRIDLKKLLCEHIAFTKIAERMNNGDVVRSNKHYNEQADYIEKLYSTCLRL